MNIESQVCSRELSKQLKELGVKQESLFYWVTDYKKWHLTFSLSQEDEFLKALKMDGEIYSAFTVAELGEMLPEDYLSCKTKGNKYPLLEYKKYWLCYNDNDGCDDEKTQMEEKEADARAKMLIYILENKLNE